MKKLKNYFKGFTLVELIIVITILSILATIAFVSFQGYVSDARDANRTATIKNIEKGLTLYQLKTNKFPAPDEPTTFTGGAEGKTKINQGIIGENVARVIQMDKIPLDPKDKSKYTYSTFGNNHKYYQVAIDSENLQTSFISKTFAFSPKSAIVQGNYRFDPSLPSLIVVPSSIEGKTIFDPKVCFVIDGGKNSLDNCIEKKEEMSLKDFDSSLVGYWDMETCTGNGGVCGAGDKLKDLSGNGNDGSFSGGMIYETALTGGFIGKGLYFSGGIVQITSKGTNLNINGTGITVSVFFKPDIQQFSDRPRIIRNGSLYNITICNHGINKVRANCGDNKRYFIGQSETQKGWIDVVSEKKYYKPSEGEKFHYISFTINLEQKIKKIFVDGFSYTDDFGQRIGVNNWDNKFIEISDYLIFGGDELYGNTRKLHGIIDDIKIYNRTLTDEEIIQQAKIAGF